LALFTPDVFDTTKPTQYFLADGPRYVLPSCTVRILAAVAMSQSDASGSDIKDFSVELPTSSKQTIKEQNQFTCPAVVPEKFHGHGSEIISFKFNKSTFIFKTISSSNTTRGVFIPEKRRQKMSDKFGVNREVFELSCRLPSRASNLT